MKLPATNKQRFERLVQLEAIAAAAKADADAYAAAWCEEVAPKVGDTIEWQEKHYPDRKIVVKNRSLRIQYRYAYRVDDTPPEPVGARVHVFGKRVLKSGKIGQINDSHFITIDCTQ